MLSEDSFCLNSFQIHYICILSVMRITIIFIYQWRMDQNFLFFIAKFDFQTWKDSSQLWKLRNHFNKFLNLITLIICFNVYSWPWYNWKLNLIILSNLRTCFLNMCWVFFSSFIYNVDNSSGDIWKVDYEGYTLL